MKRAVFKATIVGRDLVTLTGMIRTPDNFRIRIYKDGEVVITTRGRLMQDVFGTGQYTLEAVVKRLSKLASQKQETGDGAKPLRRPR
jgi:hypothetical protein